MISNNRLEFAPFARPTRLSLPLAVLGCALTATAHAQSSCPAQDSIRISEGRGILIDGRLGSSEWTDACEIRINPTYRLIVKRDSAYLYLAVARATPAVFGVNLYIAAPDSAPYLNLHASAKLGERSGRPGTWPEWQDWWNNRDWSANVVRFNAFTGERFLPDQIKEFQIALERLPNPSFLLTFDVEQAEGTETPVVGGRRRDGLDWLSLQLGG